MRCSLRSESGWEYPRGAIDAPILCATAGMLRSSPSGIATPSHMASRIAPPMANTRIRTALAALHYSELVALQVAAEQMPEVTPGLFSLLEELCDWEMHRRLGIRYFKKPRVTLDDVEIPDALFALLGAIRIAMMDHPHIDALLDAIG